MNNSKKHILIAVAWPYANGSLHLGHLAGLISSDVLSRYFRQAGHEVLMVSGSDCHGTPVALTAEKENQTPAEVALHYHKEHKENLVHGLGFTYDLFTTTTTEIHRQEVQKIFLKLYNDGLIYAKTEEHPFCEQCQKFLPDRYIEGICPFCDFAGARGDQCDNCGKLIDPRELKDPKCKHCGTTPVWKATEHFFLKLTAFQSWLETWVGKQEHWRANARNFSVNFLKEGLRDRAITRDTTWGVPIPLAGYENKSIYVWFEAVLGYVTASIEFFSQTSDPEGWKKFWFGDDVAHYYVQGKDNVPFHSVILPSILHGYDETLHLPDQFIASEYLTFEGKQFSKSRGIGVWLPDILKTHAPDVIRFYSLYNLPESADSEFRWDDFREKNNSILVASLGNFVNRVLTFTHKHFGANVPEKQENDAEDTALLSACEKAFGEIGHLIELGEIKRAFKDMFALLAEANRYIDKKAPWKMIKDSPEQTAHTLWVCIQFINNLRVLINPYLPFISEKIAKMLNTSELSWKYQEVASGHELGEVEMLFEKLEEIIL